MKLNKYIVLVIFVLVSSMTYAQPSFETEVGDAAPIPGIILAIIAAAGIGIAKLRIKK